MLNESYVEGLTDSLLDVEIGKLEVNIKTYTDSPKITKELKQDLQQLMTEKRKRLSPGGGVVLQELIARIIKLEERVKELEENQRPEKYNTEPEPDEMPEITEEQAAEHEPEPEPQKDFSPSATGMKVVDLIGLLCKYADDDIVIVDDGQVIIYGENNLLIGQIDVHVELATG